MRRWTEKVSNKNEKGKKMLSEDSEKLEMRASLASDYERARRNWSEVLLNEAYGGIVSYELEEQLVLHNAKTNLWRF